MPREGDSLESWQCWVIQEVSECEDLKRTVTRKAADLGKGFWVVREKYRRLRAERGAKKLKEVGSWSSWLKGERLTHKVVASYIAVWQECEEDPSLLDLPNTQVLTHRNMPDVAEDPVPIGERRWVVSRRMCQIGRGPDPKMRSCGSTLRVFLR
jgi:hypothetical protein